MAEGRGSLEDDLNTASLPTITEEDGESIRSGSTNNSNNKSNGEMASAAAAAAADDSEADGGGKKDKEKKKKKKGKHKDSGSGFYSAEDHDTAQQILVDLCTEMKDLKNSMLEGQEKASENLDSNQHVIQRLADQMEMLQGNMRQLDQVIESKATPEQIEELARIRAVQEMMKVVTEDKERTVGVYEQHARRGYEEIERLRQDLAAERKEVAALRAELDLVRADRQRMMSGGPGNMLINAGGDSVGGDSEGGSHTNPGALYINGGMHSSGSGRKMVGMAVGGAGGDFDDMTLETKGSYDTQAYEMKSLKKRIIHMKKKLTVAQMEAKETESLRAEVERLRVQCETEKKASAAKDETIKRLEDEIAELKRNQANAAAALAAVSGGGPKPSVASTASSHSSPPKSQARSYTKMVTHTSQPKKSKWWQHL